MSEEPIVSPGTKLQVVPEFLKSFVLTIAKTFYGPECYVVADYIQRNVCVKEEKLRQLLKFDPKSLKPFLTSLKVDKVVKERIVTEEIDGKQRKVSYYYINYKGVINVTKYKLDQIRQKLELRERDQVHTTNYKCNGCERQFEPMDVGKLYQPDTGKMICWHCYSEVKDEETTGPTENTRSSLAKFNEQTGPLVSTMQHMNGVIFAEHILEPPVPKSENVVEETPKEEPKKILNLGERSFNAANSVFNPENMKLNLGDSVDVVEQEKEAVPWLTGSVRISLADVERREAARKSRNYLRSMAKLNMIGGAIDEEIDNLLEMEKDRTASLKNVRKPTLFEFAENVKKRLNNVNGYYPEKRPRFTLGDDDEYEQKPIKAELDAEIFEQKPFINKKLSRLDLLKNDLTATYKGQKLPVTQVTEDMLENMNKKELQRVFEAREKVIDLLFRCEW